MPYKKKSLSELRQEASIFWPKELSEVVFQQSVIPLLLNTQDQFISLLNVPVDTPDDMFGIIDISTFLPQLFLKHLVILIDTGGEMLQKINFFFSDLFPGGLCHIIKRVKPIGLTASWQ
jgi:hypothetical protein